MTKHMEPTHHQHKNKKTSTGKLLLRLWRYIGHNRMLVIFAIFLSLSSSILALYGPKLSGQAINAIEAGVNFQIVLKCTVWMAVFYFSSAGLSYLLNIVMVHLSRKISGQMRHDVFENLAVLPVEYFDHYQTGDLVSVITYDVSMVNQSVSTDLLQILQSSVTVIGSFLMMISIAPQMVLIFVFTIPITIIFIRWLTTRVRPLFRRRSMYLGKLNGFVEEMLSGYKTIQAYGREDIILEQFDQKNKAAVHAYTVAETRGTIIGPCVGFINNISLTMVCVFGSVLFLRGGLRLGDLSSFVQYSRRFSGPINEIANIVSDLQSAFAAAERVFSIIDAKPEPEDTKDSVKLENVQGDVQMENVSFSYIPGKPIIQDLNFHAKPGSLTAIVGPTGSGKTTIINLLMRFYDVDSGSIYVDGKEIHDITRSSLRGSCAMVLQETWLFHGTIYENIAYGNPSATMEDVIRVAKAVHIHSYISKLPQGYNTVLSDNGSSISKGQKQILTIARAMLLDAHILILDEATSNVDTQTEQQIQTAMRVLMENKTCIVIAHRLSTIRSADHILVLERGQIVEQGNHETLMASNGVYRQLYEAQFDRGA